MPNEIAEQIKERTMRFALRVMRLCRGLPPDWEARFVADQLFRASARTSANYHAACRARSRRDFINKLGMVIEESDESVFWLTFVGRSALNETAEQKDLLAEGREIAGDLHAISEDRQREQSSIDLQLAICHLQ